MYVKVDTMPPMLLLLLLLLPPSQDATQSPKEACSPMHLI
jgi:hypothetical protein